MPEFIRTAEVVGKAAKAVYDVGNFVVTRLIPGAWGELGAKYGEAVGGYEPHPASIQYYTTPDHSPEGAKEAS